MTTQEIERAAHAATVALADFDRAGVARVLPTVPALVQALRELLAAVTAPTPPADDVREALDADVTAPWPNSMHRVWERLVEFSEAYRAERGYPPNEAARTRFLFTAFEVRPRGTSAGVPAASDPRGITPTHHAVRDVLTGALYRMPNRLIAEKVAEWHGYCEVVTDPPATDAEVEAAARAIYEQRDGEFDWDSLSTTFRTSCLPEARAAVEAARAVRS